MAYSSNESGEGFEVYLRAFPDGQQAYRISESRVQQPVRARDGQSRHYIASDGLLLRVRLGIAEGAR